ncbi:MAG: hypothetical protein Q8P32_00220 [Candidatus Komeilibacteria bacterium]|nr:hypothetical protein [Candidatus Komeilibacteria bacterium]
MNFINNNNSEEQIEAGLKKLGQRFNQPNPAFKLALAKKLQAKASEQASSKPSWLWFKWTWLAVPATLVLLIALAVGPLDNQFKQTGLGLQSQSSSYSADNFNLTESAGQSVNGELLKPASGSGEQYKTQELNDNGLSADSASLNEQSIGQKQPSSTADACLNKYYFTLRVADLTQAESRLKQKIKELNLTVSSIENTGNRSTVKLKVEARTVYGQFVEFLKNLVDDSSDFYVSDAGYNQNDCQQSDLTIYLDQN